MGERRELAILTTELLLQSQIATRRPESQSWSLSKYPTHRISKLIRAISVEIMHNTLIRASITAHFSSRSRSRRRTQAMPSAPLSKGVNHNGEFSSSCPASFSVAEALLAVFRLLGGLSRRGASFSSGLKMKATYISFEDD